MWAIIMLVLGLTALAAFAYLLTRFHGFTFIRALDEKSRLPKQTAYVVSVRIYRYYAVFFFLCLNQMKKAQAAPMTHMTIRTVNQMLYALMMLSA